MPESRKKLIESISEELSRKFPDMQPKIAEIKEEVIIYELEKHGNYAYYSVRYSTDPSGRPTVDWGSSELTNY